MVKTKALISGGNGFIGTHLREALRERDIEIHLLPRKFLYSDTSELSTYLSVIEPDYIYHLAAYVNHYTQRDPGNTLMGNIFTTYNLLEASKALPYKAFINVSSSSVLLPHETMYSATKAGAERLCRAYACEYEKPIITVRPYSVYGPGEADFRFIPTVFRSCMTGEPMTLAPDAVHDWIYVGTFAYVLAGIETIRDIDNKEINVGTGIATTNEEVVTMIEKITGKKANITNRTPMRSFDTYSWVSDAPLYNATKLYDGLQSIYEEYKAHNLNESER